MSIAENKEIARKYVEEVWGKGDYDVEREIIAEDYIDQNLAPGVPPGLAGHHLVVEGVRSAFPDMQMTLDKVIAEDDSFADYWTCTGTHTGDFFGVPATGKSVRFNGADLSRVENGKIVEIWHVEDIAGLMQQLQG